MKEIDIRLTTIRQYLLDIQNHPELLVDDQPQLGYARWAFDRLVKAALAQMDEARHVTRKVCMIGEMKQPITITSPFVEKFAQRPGDMVHDQDRFRSWFYRDVIGPIVSEENKALDHSSTRTIQTNGIMCYFDRVAEMFRIKAWEVVGFPDAAEIPADIGQPFPKERTPSRQ